jgi:hypothetical protein
MVMKKFRVAIWYAHGFILDIISLTSRFILSGGGIGGLSTAGCTIVRCDTYSWRLTRMHHFQLRYPNIRTST